MLQAISSLSSSALTLASTAASTAAGVIGPLFSLSIPYLITASPAIATSSALGFWGAFVCGSGYNTEKCLSYYKSLASYTSTYLDNTALKVAALLVAHSLEVKAATAGVAIAIGLGNMAFIATKEILHGEPFSKAIGFGAGKALQNVFTLNDKIDSFIEPMTETISSFSFGFGTGMINVMSSLIEVSKLVFYTAASVAVYIGANTLSALGYISIPAKAIYEYCFDGTLNNMSESFQKGYYDNSDSLHDSDIEAYAPRTDL